MSDLPSSYPPNNAPIPGSEALLSFDMVEERLVEAMLTCWRHADRERGWQRLRSAWPEITRDVLAGDYDARGGDLASATLKPASLTRLEVAEMEEAFGWVECLRPADRKLVGLVVTELARGRREVSWLALLARMGLTHGAEGLRKRYSRAITTICMRENPGTSAGRGLSTGDSCDASE